MKLFQALTLKFMTDNYVMVATFLTRLQKLYKNIKIILVFSIIKKWYLLTVDMFSFEPITVDDILKFFKLFTVSQNDFKSTVI